MASQSRFVIRNDYRRTMILNIEPEGAFVPLGTGEEVSVIDIYETHPVTLVLGQSGQGEPIVSFWPGDGAVRVEKDGVDVLDDEHAQQGVVAVADPLQRVAQSPPLPGRQETGFSPAPLEERPG